MSDVFVLLTKDSKELVDNKITNMENAIFVGCTNTYEGLLNLTKNKFPDFYIDEDNSVAYTDKEKTRVLITLVNEPTIETNFDYLKSLPIGEYAKTRITPITNDDTNICYLGDFDGETSTMEEAIELEIKWLNTPFKEDEEGGNDSNG